MYAVGAPLTDSLTGFFNHAAFHLFLEMEVLYSLVSGSSCSIVMVDIDSFAQFNHDHSHLEGDRWLKILAAAIRDEIRETDLAFRYTSDVFALILPECDHARALETVEHIRALLKNKQYLDSLTRQVKSSLNAAITDQLTNLYNQGYFKHFLDLEIKRSLRQRHPLGLIMLDIDDFKLCNDRYGHPAGDEILAELGHLMRPNLREIDLPAQYGGEGFALVLPYANRQMTQNCAERIRRLIQDHSHGRARASADFDLTVSMGIAVFPEHAGNMEDLIARADAQLYQAKRNGKDRICIAA